MAQGVVIVEIFIPQRQPVDALAQQIDLPMGDQRRIARIKQDLVERCDQTQVPVNLAQEQDAAIAGNVAPAKVRFDFATIKAWKSRCGVRTMWH